MQLLLPYNTLLTVSTVYLNIHLSTSEGVDYEEVTVCPTNKTIWKNASNRKECHRKGTLLEYHCVRNQDDKLIESCSKKVWIDAGNCPILHQENRTLRCERCPTVKGGVCPTSKYESNTVYLYQVCIKKPVNKSRETIQSTVFTSALPTEINGRNSIDDVPTDKILIWNVPVITAVAGVLSGCILLGIIGYCKFKHTGSKSDQNTVTMDEGQALLSDAPKVYLIQPPNAAIEDEITIQCVIRGNSPVSSITWKKDGVPIFISDNDKYGGGNIAEPDLTIKKVSLDDASTYQCSATSEEGTGESELVNLNVVDYLHTFQDIEFTERKPIEALRKVEQVIWEEGMVVIVGDIGSGKTTAAEHAMLYVHNRDGINSWNSESMEYNFDEEIETEKAGKRIMIVLDDCCGKYGTNPVYLNQMKEKLCRLQSTSKINSERRKIISTLTSAQFSLIKNSVKDAGGQSLIKCSIKLADISDAERKDMLAEYINTRDCRCQNCKGIKWVQVKEYIEEDMYLSNLQVVGWPLICRMVVIPHIAQNIKQFLDKPLFILQQVLEELRKTDTAAYVGLVYMMLRGGTFDEDLIDHECLRHVLQLHSVLPDHDLDLVFSTKLVNQQLKAIPEYVKYNNEKFTFFHEIIRLALFCSFYKSYPNETVQYCDLSIIADLFRRDDYDSSAECKVEPLLEELFTRESTCTNYSGTKTAKNKHKPKCYFILSEENHKVFMRRVSDEGMLSVFEGHPLLLEEKYTQIN